MQPQGFPDRKLISGFKRYLEAFFKKKVKTLLVPYVGISLAVFWLQPLWSMP
jgi:hypothetical protein